jgi:EAL domain-containing protein (putative c-di-GMP-specific phosphodiesterase class I)
VLHCACQQLRRWQLSDPALAELTMSVNLSAHDLGHPALIARVSQAIVEASLRPEHLTLELTEDIVMAHVQDAQRTLAALRQLGVRLAVDDFGTGYSSLSHLSRLPIDSLKIDRGFISRLQPGSDDAAVVSAIVQLGGSLRKAVVAEGIESAAQMEHLQELGCRFGQAFTSPTRCRNKWRQPGWPRATARCIESEPGGSGVPRAIAPLGCPRHHVATGSRCAASHAHHTRPDTL